MMETTITTDINLHMHMKTRLRTVFVVPTILKNTFSSRKKKKERIKVEKNI